MGALFGGRGSPRPERYAGMQVSTSLQGQVIPILWGRNRATMNVIWYGNFQSHPSSQGGGKGGGGQTTGYTYNAAFIAALTMGPIKGLHNVYHDRSTVTLTYENLALALGASGQPTWTGYPSGTPAVQQIPYDHLAYVASQNYNFGSSAAMPNLTFELEGVVGGYYNAGGVYDADVSVIITDYLTDPVHGAGFLGTINTSLLTGTTNTFQAYCMSLGITLSPYEDSQRSATDFLKEIMQITNSDIVMSGGVLKVIPYADQPVSGTTPDGVNWSYTPNLTPVYSFTDSDYCPEEGKQPVLLTRKALADTYNVVNIEYVDRSNYYNPGYAAASDLADITLNGGPRLMSTLSFHSITQAPVARIVAQLILQFQLYERNTYEFRVRADYSLLEPMDYIAITDSGLGLVNQVCRVLEVQDDKNSFFTIKCMEVPGTVRNTPQYNWNACQGYAANFDEAPLNVATPMIFAMPQIPGSISEGITLGVVACGQSTDAAWGGCEVHMSVDGGNNYFYVGIIGPGGEPRYGTITSNVSAVADPDTTTTMGVALANTTEQLSTAVTNADADSNQTLIMVGTGNTAEVMSYGAASLVSAGNYNLSYLRRNLYNSANQTHSSGAPFVRLDGSVFQLALDPGMAGQTVYFKFPSFNTVGRATQDISTLSAYSYVLPSAQASNDAPVVLQARGYATLSGTSAYKTTTATNAWDSDVVSTSAYSALVCKAVYGSLGNGSAASIGFSLLLTSSTASVGTRASQVGTYGILVTGSVGGQIFVQGNQVATFTPAVGDEYQLIFDGFTLNYLRNGTSLYTTPLTGAFYASLALESGGATVSGLQVQAHPTGVAVQWKGVGNATVGNNTITGGTVAWGGAAAYSISGYSNCHVSGKPVSASMIAMLGLSTSPTASASYTNANYAWHDNGGTWQIYESGTLVGSYGAVSTADVVAITYDGSTITYLLNGSSQRTVSISGLALFGFAPFYSTGSGWNSVLFGPTTSLEVIDTSQVSNNAISQSVVVTSATGYSTSLHGGPISADALTGSITTAGGVVGVDVSFTGGADLRSCSFNSPVQFYITRDGAQVGTSYFDLYDYVTSVTPQAASGIQTWSTPVALTIMDTPLAGAHTYALHLNGAQSTTGTGSTLAQVAVTNITLKLREYKK